MELFLMGLIVSIAMLSYAVYLRVCYMKHEAVCLEYSTSEMGFVTYPLYMYELIENGKKVTYKSSGTTICSPKKGKRYKVLINKKNHYKVVGYREYIVDLCVGVGVFIASITELIF